MYQRKAMEIIMSQRNPKDKKLPLSSNFIPKDKKENGIQPLPD